MALELITGPSTEPLTLSEAKTHLRVDSSDEDSYITDLIKAARIAAEQYTRTAIISQTWDLHLDSFPEDDEDKVIIPLPPVTSVTHVYYYDENNTQQTWSSSLYETDLVSRPARLYPVYGQEYPTTYDKLNAVTIRFVAGYDDAASVPDLMKAALKIIIADLFEVRQTKTDFGLSPVAKDLLNVYRDFRFGGKGGN